MNVFKIPEALEAKYQGSGYALAAIRTDGSALIDFAYCREIDESFDKDCGLAATLAAVADNPRFRAQGEFFEVAGHSRMAFGMVSCGEFCEL